MTTTRPLGETASKVQAHLVALDDFHDDPITRASGCAGELSSLVARHLGERIERDVRDGGFDTYDAFLESVEAATSPRWVHFYSTLDAPLMPETRIADGFTDTFAGGAR